MYLFIKKALFPTLIFAAVFMIMLYFVKDYKKNQENTNYTLKSYKNTVALYKDDELIKVYSNIVLNTLPEKDIQNFNSGVEVLTPTQAEALLEDFDG